MAVRANAIVWFIQRITGILLLFFLFTHFWVMHFTGTGEFLYKDVAARLSNPFWKGFYIGFLICAIYHAFTGVRMIVLDFGFPRFLERLFSWALIIVGVALFIWGFSTILSVRPV